ncbi:sigma-54 dependent transcriptional regulator [bacterium]|nr:sigma-54 dependent transcriptional regulator [bacterium]
MSYEGCVLVADDEPNMREALDLTLSRMGFSVHLASDGHEAIAKLHGPDAYRLMVTDVNMPRATGMDVLREAQKLRPEMPCVVITGFGTIQNAVEAMKLGASDYIVKPFNADALEAAIGKHLDDARPSAATQLAAKGDRPLLTRSPNMIRILKIAENIARTDATVLIEGESGTGKELLALHIHRNSPRKNRPFVAVNCAAVPEQLLESELFGHEKGSFTGAVTSKKGKFEMADGGTILLDEIGEMDPVLQSKLLRVLQEREVDRVGGNGPKAIDVRVVCTTNANLPKLVADGKFREDLFYRLNVIPLTLPPLRDRQGDVTFLAEHFVTHFARKYERGDMAIDEPTRRELESFAWKGNVRELSNTIERAVLLTEGRAITRDSLTIVQNRAFTPAHRADDGLAVAPGTSIRDMEKRLILATLDDMGGNRTKAAKTLGISIRTLRNKLHEYGYASGGDDADEAEEVAV